MLNKYKTLGAVILALGGAALVTGCGEDHEICPELCERSSECPEVLGDEDTCVSTCNAELESAEEKGCEEQWEAYQECASHSTNLCQADLLHEECSVQYDAYTSCGG